MTIWQDHSVAEPQPKVELASPDHQSALLRHPIKEPIKMIRKLKSGEYRLYSRKKDSKTGKRRNLGTFPSLEKAKTHERAVQFFKRH